MMDMKHSLVVMYLGYNPTKDAEIRKLIGDSSGSGFSGFGFGVRDLFFDCKSKKDATERAAKLKGMNVRTSIRRIA
jgi:hypothetical protein